MGGCASTAQGSTLAAPPTLPSPVPAPELSRTLSERLSTWSEDCAWRCPLSLAQRLRSLPPIATPAPFTPQPCLSPPPTAPPCAPTPILDLSQGEEAYDFFASAEGMDGKPQLSGRSTPSPLGLSFASTASPPPPQSTPSPEGVRAMLEAEWGRLKTLRLVLRTAGLDGAQQRAFLHALEPLSFCGGQRIVEQGERGSALYIITEGAVQVTQRGGGPAGSEAERAVSRLFEGHWFGETSLLPDALPQASVRAAAEGVRCMVMRRAAFQPFLAQHPGFCDMVSALVPRVEGAHRLAAAAGRGTPEGGGSAGAGGAGGASAEGAAAAAAAPAPAPAAAAAAAAAAASASAVAPPSTPRTAALSPLVRASPPPCPCPRPRPRPRPSRSPQWCAAGARRMAGSQ